MISVRKDKQRQTEGGRMWLKVQAAFFYTYDRMLASANPGWLQTVFDTLMGLFDQVGLKPNVQKTVGILCHPFRVVGVRAD